MRPRELVQLWVEAFNRADADGLASFYSEDAVNHQVAETPVQGKDAIRQMFAAGFASATMVCIVEILSNTEDDRYVAELSPVNFDLGTTARQLR